jgi:uncharacterized protein YcfJ
MSDRDPSSPDELDASARDDQRPEEHVVGNVIGETVGGVSGIATGMALGSLGGPVGTIIGGIAGAIGGWWSGRTIAEAAHHYTDADDSTYRARYERSADRLADRHYDDIRPAYQIGHLASRNPDYAGRDFADVEADLRRGWTDRVSAAHGEWDHVRSYARDAFERGRASGPHHAPEGAYGAGREAHRAHEVGRDVADGLDDVWRETRADEQSAAQARAAEQGRDDRAR